MSGDLRTPEEQRLNLDQGLIQGLQQRWQKHHGLSSDPSLSLSLFFFFLISIESFVKNIYLLYLAALSLSFGTQALLAPGEILSTWGLRVLLPCGMRNLSSPTRVEPTPQALEGGFLTTGPSGKYPLFFGCVEGQISLQHTSSLYTPPSASYDSRPRKDCSKNLEKKFFGSPGSQVSILSSSPLLKPKC